MGSFPAAGTVNLKKRKKERGERVCGYIREKDAPGPPEGGGARGGMGRGRDGPVGVVRARPSPCAALGSKVPRPWGAAASTPGRGLGTLASDVGKQWAQMDCFPPPRPVALQNWGFPPFWSTFLFLFWGRGEEVASLSPLLLF